MWASSTTLITDPVDQVAALKGKGTSMVIFGSAELTQSLTAAGLVDRFVVMIHPVLCRTWARRLFPPPARLLATGAAGQHHHDDRCHDRHLRADGAAAPA